MVGALTFFLLSSQVLSLSNRGSSCIPLTSFCSLGNTKICRLINDLTVLNNYEYFDEDMTISRVTELSANGFFSFETKDFCERSNRVVGKIHKGKLSSSIATKECQFLTSWNPIPQLITRKIVITAVDHILLQHQREAIDLLELNWWDYDNFYYFNAISHLMELRDDGKVLDIGLENFDTEHLRYLLEEKAPIVSNKVSFSLIDTRAKHQMLHLCEENDIKVLCQECLLGGFLSSNWLRHDEPTLQDLESSRLEKYLGWINRWGSWSLFQELLTCLQQIATKHRLNSISVIALRWVLQQSNNTAVVTRSLLDPRKRTSSNEHQKLFSFELDEEDLEKIEGIQKRSNHQGESLFKHFGDCGSEFRQVSRIRKKRYQAILI